MTKAELLKKLERFEDHDTIHVWSEGSIREVVNTDLYFTGLLLVAR